MATVRIRQVLDGVILHGAGLHDFHLHDFALGDLNRNDHQWYGPAADRKGIRDVIDDRCHQWLGERVREPRTLH